MTPGFDDPARFGQAPEQMLVKVTQNPKSMPAAS